MTDVFVTTDMDEARSIVLSRRYKVFTLLVGDEKYKSEHSTNTYKSAYKTVYHVHRNAIEFENVIRAEGIGLEWNGTNFGLEEMIITKIK